MSETPGIKRPELAAMFLEIIRDWIVDYDLNCAKSVEEPLQSIVIRFGELAKIKLTI